jgi:hypothetical protein
MIYSFILVLGMGVVFGGAWCFIKLITKSFTKKNYGVIFGGVLSTL